MRDINQPVSLARVVDDNSEDPGVRTIAKLAALAVTTKGVTDVFVRKGSPTVYKQSGKRMHAIDWDLGPRGVIDNKVFHDMLNYLHKSAHGAVPESIEEMKSFTQVFCTSKTQVRIQFAADFHPPELFFRFQPLEPYPLESFLGSFPDTMASLQRAKGLVVVCGAQACGKTSLMSSIARSWAGGDGQDEPRHVLMAADPIEYYLPPEKYLVSSVQCAMTSADRGRGLRTLSDIMPDVLRSSINAFSVGEVRESATLRECLTFSASSEPVITTLHAASIPECFIRMFALADEYLSDGVARLLLASTLEGILYVNMAYTSGGASVPIVQYLPTRAPQIRRTIAEADGKSMIRDIAKHLSNPSSGQLIPGSITRKMAIDAALARGVRAEEANRALGPDLAMDLGVEPSTLPARR